ncbi:hypothetical protein ACIHJG_39840 [Streptomyces sp. NPDC052415]|uniref:hypothetical protein n=1 Tax=Streptomyces sp. NPDC052415 TaxID=3365690 RepID=UPI0037D44723
MTERLIQAAEAGRVKTWMTYLEPLDLAHSTNLKLSKVVTAGDGLVLMPADHEPREDDHGEQPAHDLIRLVEVRDALIYPSNRATRDVELSTRSAAHCLVLSTSPRWQQALETALLGPWSDSLWDAGQLPRTALSTLKAETRTLHRQLVPIWRRGTQHGRVLSLDADLGGISLHDLVAADVDLLSHNTRGVFEDERLNAVLRALDPAERQVVFSYAGGEGTTWTEAATAVGATSPEAFGERVRRKAKRLAAEQLRRAAQRRP